MALTGRAALAALAGAAVILAFRTAALTAPFPRRQCRDLRLTEPVLGEPFPARTTDSRRRSRGRPAALGAADSAPQQRMFRCEHQDLPGRIPTGLGEEGRVHHGSDPTDVVVDPLAGEHMLPGRGTRYGCQRLRSAHRSIPDNARGLGTRSTASRTRAGSGCR